MNQKHSK